ncbi:MAG: hypothetical protein ABR500_07320 [Dermatophilaceae bacterium]|nr:hypothetical protein [Intrasporangiaceae bacterium]
MTVVGVTVVAVLLALSACTGSSPVGTPSGSTPASTEPSSSPTATSASTTTPTETDNGTSPTATTPSATTPTGVVITETPSARAIHRTTVVITAPPGFSEPTGVDACTGMGDYASVGEGDVVRVVDGSGTLLTSVTLRAGRPSGETNACSWSAEVSLPTDRGSYRALIEGWGSSGLLTLDDLLQPIVIEPSE